MQVFPDDIVRRWDNPETVGRVCCLDGDANGADGAGAALDDVPAEAHVHWLRALDNDCMEPIARLEVVDRAILHGDTVREVLADGNHAQGASAERVGIVIASSVKVDARELATGTLHRDVCSRRLRHAQPFRTGTFVVRDGWLGRVESWLDDLVISFPNGTRYRARGVSPAQLIPIECPYTVPYCQNMMVRAVDPDFFHSCCEILEPAKPRPVVPVSSASPASSPPAAPEGNRAQIEEVTACGTAEGESTGGSSKEVMLTVGRIETVQAGEASIEWLTPCNSGASASPPAPACDPSLLRPLVAFAHTWWNLSDIAVFMPGTGKETAKEEGDLEQAGHNLGPPACVAHCSAREREGDCARRELDGSGRAATATWAAAGSSSEAPIGASGVRFDDGANAATDGNEACGYEDGADDCGIRVEVVGLSTRVTVLWQNGEMSEMPAASLMLHNPGPQTFFPRDIVQLRSANDDLFSEVQHCGHDAQHVRDDKGGDAVTHSVPGAVLSPQVPRAGYVVSVDTAARLVHVKWLPQQKSADETSEQTCEAQTLSSFELSLHRSYSFRLGDAVTRVSSSSSPCRVAQPLEAADTGTDINTATGATSALGSTSTDERECSAQPTNGTCSSGCVGEVVALLDGRVGVAWLEGNTGQRVIASGKSSSDGRNDCHKRGYDLEWLRVHEVQLIGNDIDAAAYANAETADEYHTSSAPPSEHHMSASGSNTSSGSAKQNSTAGDKSASTDRGRRRASLADTSDECQCNIVAVDKDAPGSEARSASIFAKNIGHENKQRSILAESASVPVLPVAPDAWQIRDSNGDASEDVAIEQCTDPVGAIMTAPRWRWLKGLQTSLSSLLRIQSKAGQPPQKTSDGHDPCETRSIAVVAAGGGAGAARVLARARSHAHEDVVDDTGDVAKASEAGNGPSEVVSTASNASRQSIPANDQMADKSQNAAEAAAATQPFEVLETGNVPPDHAFLLSCTMEEADASSDGQSSGGGTLARSAWTRRAHREWRQLRRGLPDDGSVHVFAFEERLDLLRAVVRGPANTPYSCALFFFDIRLPPLYPSVPPDVFFWSFGERLNPNLYENGKVCLSLLGTWSGKSVETWSAATSNLLQVLISIQGLVLVKEPYFNEPGYEAERGTARGEASSRQYDEAARLLSLQSLLRVLRSPPQCTATLVQTHARAVGATILQDIQALLAGRITCNGTNVSEDCQDCQDSSSAISAGMRIALDTLLPKLRAELSQIGCEL